VDRKDITLRYYISSPSGEIVVEKSKTVAIETQSSFVADLEVPASQKPGKYILRVSLAADSGNAGSDVSFSVVRKASYTIMYIIAASLIFLVMAIFFVLHVMGSFRLLKMRMKISKIVRKRLKDTNYDSERYVSSGSNKNSDAHNDNESS